MQDFGTDGLEQPMITTVISSVAHIVAMIVLANVMVVLTFLLGCLDKSGSGWRVIRDSYHDCSN